MRLTANPRTFVVAAAHRRSVTYLSTLALVFASAGRLTAADEPPVGVQQLARLTVVSVRLMSQAKTVEALGRYGFAKGGHCLLGASLPGSRGAALTLTGILKVEPANGARVVIQPAMRRW